PLFREHLDRCFGIVARHLGRDLREILFAAAEEGKADGEHGLSDTFLAQPALFSISYALARLLGEWGLRPAAMAGHSVGEFVCACLSGVLSLEDALRLVTERGRLMRALPSGAMLSVRLAAS